MPVLSTAGWCMGLKYMQVGAMFSATVILCPHVCTCAVLALDGLVRLSVHSTTNTTNTNHYARRRCSILEVALPASPNRDSSAAVDALRAAAAACSDGLLLVVLSSFFAIQLKNYAQAFSVVGR